MRAGIPHGTDSYEQAAAGAGPPGGAGGGPRAAAEKAGPLDAAAALAAEGRHEEAAAACDAAARADPGAAWAARAQRAASLEALGRGGEAIRECQKALRAPEGALEGPARLDAALRLGRLHMGAGRAAKAANHLAKEAGRGPGEPAALLAYRALALVLDDRHSEALAAVSGAGEPARGDPAVLAVEARALYETGRYGEAAERCRRACGADAGCSAAWLYAGMAADAEGRREDAAAAYERAAAIDPDEGDMAGGAGAAGRAHALCRTGRHAEAAALLAPAAAAAGPADARVRCLAGEALAGCGRREEADAHLRAAASSRPANSDGLYYAGLASYLLGRGGEARRYDEAAAHLKGALSRNRESKRAADLAERTRAARLEAGSRRRAEAGRMEARRAEAERKEAAEAAAARRRRAEAGGGGRAGGARAAKRAERRRQEAEREGARRAAEDAARAEAVALSGGGRFEDSLAAFSRASPLRTGDSEGWDARARALYGLGRYGEAARCFKAARPGEPDGADALAAAAAAAAQRARRRQYDEGHTAISNYNEALYRIQAALEADPRHHEALVLGGTIHAHSANIKSDMVDTSYGGALALLDRALETDLYDAAALYHRGRILEKLGRGAEARTAYGQAGTSRARRLEDHFCIGRSLDALGRFGEARAHYLEGMRLDPDLAGLHAELAGAGAGGGPDPAPPQWERSGLAVADTNVAMPCIVGECAADCDLPDDVRSKSYFAGRLAGLGDAGGGRPGETVIVPWACRGEILGILPGLLSGLRCHEGRHGDVIARVKDALGAMPSERAVGFSVGYADSLRVIKMYWRAWLRMGDAEKDRWQGRKKANGRLSGGGPPEGAVDTKVLALAAKIAAEQSRTVTLYTCDEDFGAFSRHIAGIGVRVAPA